MPRGDLIAPRHAATVLSGRMKNPEVHLYTICWNEADMLGFFFRHYDPWVSRFIIFDDGSDDGSREILASHPKVELRTFTRAVADSFVLSHRLMQDTAWKESSQTADWIVTTAIDEHLHVRGRSMNAYLAEQKSAGVTLMPALGFDMNAPEMPADHGLLIERVTRGRPRAAFNKLGIFDPTAIEETNFGAGRHSAEPQGKLVLPQRDELMLWHYKHLGFERNSARESDAHKRLGRTDLANGYGRQYSYSPEQRRSFWDEMEAQSRDLAAAGFEPDRACVRPLWWCDRPGIFRAQPPTGF